MSIAHSYKNLRRGGGGGGTTLKKKKSLQEVCKKSAKYAQSMHRLADLKLKKIKYMPNSVFSMQSLQMALFILLHTCYIPAAYYFFFLKGM